MLLKQNLIENKSEKIIIYEISDYAEKMKFNISNNHDKSKIESIADINFQNSNYRIALFYYKISKNENLILRCQAYVLYDSIIEMERSKKDNYDK